MYDFQRLSPIKQTKHVLQCIVKFQPGMTGRFFYFGFGEQREALKTYVSESVSEKQHFLKMEERTYRFILSVDWFVIASEYKTFAILKFDAGEMECSDCCHCTTGF